MIPALFTRISTRPVSFLQAFATVFDASGAERSDVYKRQDNIVNDEKWRELLQDEIRNSNWRDVVMEKLCKLVGVKR